MKKLLVLLLFTFISAQSFAKGTAGCLKKVEKSAVNAARKYFKGTDVSDTGKVTQVRNASHNFDFYIVEVTDESGTSYWTVVRYAIKGCKIVSTTLVYSE